MTSAAPDRAPGTVDSALPVLALLGGSVLWGLSWLPLKHFARFGIEGVIVTLVAHGSVGAIALSWLLSRAETFRHQRRGMLVLAVLGGLSNLAFATAIVNGDVVRVMVLFYLLPAWGVLGGRLILGERIDAKRWAGLVCALFGAYLVLGGVSLLEQAPSFTDLLAVVAGMALAFQNIAFRKFTGLSVSVKVGAVFAGCLLWAAPLCALGVQTLPSGVPGLVWLELVAFGLVWLSTATVTTLWAVGRMEAGKSSILIIMELVTAVASAAILSQRRLLPLEWTGGALIVLAAFLEAWPPVRVSALKGRAR